MRKLLLVLAATVAVGAAPALAQSGAVSGAVTGGVVGAVVGGPVGAAVGAGVGATTGAVADDADRRSRRRYVRYRTSRGYAVRGNCARVSRSGRCLAYYRR